MEKEINKVAQLIVAAQKIVVFTGAGVSTESGIPDFRSPGGIWTKFDPEDFTIDKFLSSRQTRQKMWKLLLEGGLIANVQPNAAHWALAELEKMGKLSCIITQNVDNLHQKAGNDPAIVHELHGNMQWLVCMDCGKKYQLEQMIANISTKDQAPECPQCRGILKPGVIFFGEVLPPKTLLLATQAAQECDLFMIIGSSLVVYPAAYMPLYARDAGAKIVIINLGPTGLDDVADVIIDASAGATMTKILERLKA